MKELELENFVLRFETNDRETFLAIETNKVIVALSLNTTEVFALKEWILEMAEELDV